MLDTLLIGAEGAKTPAGVRGRGDPAGAERRGGSPARPRKAKRLERQSTGQLAGASRYNVTFFNNLKKTINLMVFFFLAIFQKYRK
jgi:hypothetical protein